MAKVKEFYADPKMEVIRFEVEDIILTLDTSDKPDIAIGLIFSFTFSTTSLNFSFSCKLVIK